MGKHYGVPTHGYLGLSDSKALDGQSSFESGMGILLAAMAGMNIVSGPGMQASENCQSLEKLIIDNELCGTAYRLVEGITVDETALATEIIAKVGNTVEMLGIGHLLKRSTNGLSGGEKQRVALARALVLQPKVLLLDEPVCALDEVTRQAICGQLFHIQRQLGLTTIHVSHNLEEAFSVADRAAVLHQGLLQQVGPLDELLRKPSSEFVARFMRCENILSGKVISPGSQSANTEVIVGDLKLHLPGRHDGDVEFVIRPEDVLVLPGQQHDNKSKNEFPAKLVRRRDCGGYVRIELDGAIKLTAHLTHSEFAELQARHQPNLIVRLSPENIHVLPK